MAYDNKNDIKVNVDEINLNLNGLNKIFAQILANKAMCMAILELQTQIFSRLDNKSEVEVKSEINSVINKFIKQVY
jgi:hypothetical protein